MSQLIVFKELIQIAPEHEIDTKRIIDKISHQCDIFSEVSTLSTLI